MEDIPRLDPVAFILGTARSGTTLLRVMLAGHPRLFSPPEMVIAPFSTMAERRAHLDQRFWEKGGLRRALMELEGLDVERAKAAEAALEPLTVPQVYAHLQQRMSGRMLVDKCPHLCLEPRAMTRLAGWFPEARWLWIVRHPGSVLRSLENMPMAEVMLKGLSTESRELWLDSNKNVQRFLEAIPSERWAMIRYEDLVTDPRPVMERACRALDVPFHEATLDPYEGDRMREGPKGARAIGDPNMATRGKIDPELATKWLEGFDPRTASPATRAYAKELGYDLDALPLPPIAKVTEGLAALWDAAREIEAGTQLPMDLDALEGRRFLLRILAASLDVFVEQGDADRPRFHHAEGPSRKMFADCPDADYLRAPIRLGDGRSYRVRGRVPEGTLYVGIVLYGKGGRVGGFLSDREIPRDAEGRFEVRVSAEAGADLCGEGDETAVIVRQYFADRRAEKPIDLSIDLDGTPAPPAPLDALVLARQVEQATRMVRSVFGRTIEAYKMASTMALNRFVEVPGEQLFPTPDNRYRIAWYRFGGNQVMLVRGRLPKARYFGLTLYNAWLESLDYERHTITLNHTQIRHASDGAFEVCLAHRDPGHPNWLDTAGHGAGYLIARALLPEADLPDLEIEVLYESEWEARKASR